MANAREDLVRLLVAVR